MKKLFFPALCVVFLFSVLFPLFFPVEQSLVTSTSFSSNSDYVDYPFAVVVADSFDNAHLAEKFFLDNKVSGIVSLKTELAHFPDDFSEHPYYKNVLKWFVDSASVRFFLPWTKTVAQLSDSSHLKELSGLSILTPQTESQIKSVFYVILAFILSCVLIFL